MNKTKRITYIFSILLAIVVFFGFFFAPIKAKADSGVELTGRNVYAYAQLQNTTPTDGKWYVRLGVGIDLDDDGTVESLEKSQTYGIMNSNPFFESITLKVRTRNASAIAELGDYDPVQGEYTITKANFYATIAISIHDVGMSISGKGRVFYLDVYEANVVGLKDSFTFIDPTDSQSHSSLALNTYGEMTFTSRYITESDGNQVEVLDQITTKSQNLSGRGIYESAVHYSMNLESVNGDWYEKIRYLSNNNLVKLGVALDGRIKQTDLTWLYIENSFVVIDMYATNVAGNASTRFAKWHIKFQNDEEEYAGLESAFEGTFEDVTVRTELSQHVAYTKDRGNVVVHDDICITHPNRIMIDDFDALFGTLPVAMTRVYIYQGDEEKEFLTPTNINYMPVNYRAKIVDAQVGSLRFDEKGNRKLGLSMRFNEPMQLRLMSDGTEAVPSMTATINGNGANTLDFIYVEGSGTDTFYFEADVSEKSNNISSLTLKNAYDFENVVDFPPWSNGQKSLNLILSGGALHGWESVSDRMTCSFDLRIPEITLTKEPTSAIRQTHLVNIAMSNIGEDGLLYYAWTENDPSVDPTVPTKLSVAPIVSLGTQTIVSPTGISGERWLYVKAVSAIGRVCEEPIWAGPYYFDSQAPTIGVVCTNNQYKTKTFALSVNNNPLGNDKCAGFDSLEAIVATDPLGNDVVKRLSIKVQDESLLANAFKMNYTITAEMLGLTTDEYGEYYLAFKGSDELQNEYTTPFIAYQYDTRDLFDITFESEGELNIKTDTGTIHGYLENERYAMDMSVSTSFNFVTRSGVQPRIEKFINVKTGLPVSKSDYKEFWGLLTQVNTITLFETFSPGLYELQFYDATSGSSQKSLTQYLYVTNGKEEDTSVYYQSRIGSVLRNNVYQLPATMPFYYATDIGSVKTENYGNSTKPATFSTYSTAWDYVYYYELQDLFAVTLTEDLAQELNYGNGDNKKANGTTVEAQEGQVWIRYKRKDWKPMTTTSAWVYYYYSDGETVVDGENLPWEIDLALYSVATTICDMGSYVDLVLDEYLDKNGSPTLASEQMHVLSESITMTKCGTAFEQPVVYEGDSSLYVSGDVDAPLSSNIVLNESANSFLYYKTETSEYRLLQDFDGKTLRDCFGATGKFKLLEFDENGVHEYSVYIDAEAPTLSVIWRSHNGETRNQTYKDINDGRTFSGGTCYLSGLSDGDYLSFIAVYRYTSQGEGDYLAVYRMADFDDGMDIPLADGKYHIHVSDRSGNDYALVFEVKSDPLICSVREVKNSSIQIEVNRDESEVTYQVYLDGALLTTDFNERKFTKSGYYQILIEDNYGNVYDEFYYAYEYETDTNGNYVYDAYGNKIPKLDAAGNKIPIYVNGEREYAYYHFTRDLPLVSWKYQLPNGGYENYSESAIAMRIARMDEKNYLVSTSVPLQFLPMSECSYEILSGSPEASKHAVTGWVTLKTLTSFSMKVSYEKHPESYVIYTCSVDVSTPRINVTYQENTFEFSEFNEIGENADKFNVGNNEFTPSFIGFETVSDRMVYVANGSVASSSYFKLSVSDESGISYVEVSLDGEVLLQERYDFSNILLSRRGQYVIRAMDNFGNESVFRFTNKRQASIQYFVDDTEYDADESSVKWFDYEKKEYTKVEFGNAQMKIVVPKNAEIYYMITMENGDKHYLSFDVDNGFVFPTKYNVVCTDATENRVETIELVRSASLIEQVLTSIGVGVYVTTDTDGMMHFTVRSSDQVKKLYTVEARVVVPNEVAPYYLKSELSSLPSQLQFVDEEGVVFENDALNLKVNRPFVVSPMMDESIRSVQIAHSETGDFKNYQTIFDVTYTHLLRNEEGMHHIQVINKYGTVTNYFVILASKFSVTASVTYADETQTDFMASYAMSDAITHFYSNKSVEFIVHANEIKVTLNGNPFHVTENEQGYFEVYLQTSGEVVIEDEYGNIFRKTVEIVTKSVPFEEDFLKGFNQDALRKDEGYTNEKVTVDFDEISTAGISFVSLTLADETYVLYNEIGPTKVLDTENLLSCVGAYGNGEYKVTLRDKYGNKAEKIVHYCGTSTLTVLRKTLVNLHSIPYSLEDVEEKGVWTNDAIFFEVSAIEYILTVDGMENVTSMHYDTKTKNEYEVFYLDEYGFTFRFTVHFLRQDVSIEASASMQLTNIDDILVTNDDVSVTFTDSATCTYILSGGDPKPYQAGDRLYKDGVYRFVVEDKAGNLATYVVQKDSIVEYRVEGSGVREVLVNGGVTNGTTAQFYVENGDTAYLKKVFHNGVLLEDYDDTRFTERGKWELIVADEVGNESYFRFYILQGKMNEFHYETPYDYVIVNASCEFHGIVDAATDAIKDDGKRLEATRKGTYRIRMVSQVTGDEQTFSFVIDNTPPQVTLDGCEIDEKTVNNVTIKGHNVGDVIYVYKDGKLVNTVRIETSTTDAPVISEGGKYRIVVENEAGVTTTLTFERTYIPNVAGSVLIIVLTFAGVVGLLVGLIWRNHSKTDE